MSTWPRTDPVFKRQIYTSRADRACDSVGCFDLIHGGEDYTCYELGWPKSPVWARRRRHLRCTPTSKHIAIGQLEGDLNARLRAGDFDAVANRPWLIQIDVVRVARQEASS